MSKTITAPKDSKPVSSTPKIPEVSVKRVVESQPSVEIPKPEPKPQPRVEIPKTKPQVKNVSSFKKRGRPVGFKPQPKTVLTKVSSEKTKGKHGSGYYALIVLFIIGMAIALYLIYKRVTKSLHDQSQVMLEDKSGVVT